VFVVVACGHAPAPRPAVVAPRPVAVASTPTKPVAAAAKAPFDASAALERGRAANTAFDFEAALPDLEAAVEVFQRELKPGDDKLDDALDELGYTYQGLQRWNDSIATLTVRLDGARASGDRYREAGAMGGLALAIKRSGDLHRALTMIEEALKIDVELDLPESDRGHLNRLHSLANVYDDLGEHARAARMLEKVLAYEKAADPNGQRTATVTHNLALAYRDAGELEKARTMFETALRMSIVLDGPTSQSVVTPLNGLAGTLKLMGKYEDAIQAFERVLALVSKTSSVRPIALADLGDSEIVLGRTDVGIAHIDEALAILRKVHPAGHPETVFALVKRTGGLLAAGRIDEANHDTDEAISMAIALDGADGARVTSTVKWLADIWQDAGQAQRAKQLRKQLPARRTAKASKKRAAARRAK
jgi:tetratricopeptide (TPR) repeat protein